MPIARIKDTTFHREVYEPAEDSFLLVDALAAEWRSTLRLRPPRVVVEVGCGTGYVIASAALLAREHEASREARVDDDDAAEATTSTASGRDTARRRFYATDVNRDALAATRATAAAHGVAHLLETCECDLLSAPGLFASLRNATDVLLFNPPYVLTPSEEVTRGGVAAAWAGGVDGREVTDRLLPLVHDVLRPGRDVHAHPAGAEQAEGGEGDPRGTHRRAECRHRRVDVRGRGETARHAGAETALFKIKACRSWSRKGSTVWSCSGLRGRGRCVTAAAYHVRRGNKARQSSFVIPSSPSRLPP